MLTDEQLHSIMPAASQLRRDALLPFLQAAITEFAIDAAPRSAAFLAQLAHESGQLRFMEEIWGPTPAQERYEPPSSLATRLGNTQPGDGRRFKGRGPIQITGRDNYRRFGRLLGIDLEADPARAALPELGFRIAGLFWRENGLNELADQVTDAAFVQITRRINGGINGLAERRRFYAIAREVLGVAAVPVERGRGVRAVPAEAPVFERGAEALREHVPAPRPRRISTPRATAKGKPKPKPKAKSPKPKPKAKPKPKPKAKPKPKPKPKAKSQKPKAKAQGVRSVPRRRF